MIAGIMEGASDVTVILDQIREGNRVAADQLLPLVYHELRQLALRKMAREPAGQTLQATALVHEAWLRVGGESQSWESRVHFFGAAAEAMRRILIDSARRKQTEKHGGKLERIGLEDTEIAAPIQEDELLAIHEVLDAFAAHDAKKAELVKLRYFGGLTIEEASDVLGISVSMAKRYWTYARMWLYREISASRNDSTEEE